MFRLCSLLAALGLASARERQSNNGNGNGNGPPINVPGQLSQHAKEVLDFWTPARVRNAKPRDFVYDSELDVRHLRQLAKPTTSGIADDPFTNENAILKHTAGRILFAMNGNTYVCSGTVVNDGTVGGDKSVILTAAHCVYDDVAKAFATMAMFIPNQDKTTGTGTDNDCSNDPYGCW